MIYVFFRYGYIFWYFFIFLTKPRIFNILIDSSSLNTFSSSFLHLLQIIERANVLSKKYDFLYLPKILKFLIYQNFYTYFINKSNTKVSAHYLIIYLYSKNICYIFVFYEFLKFFWNMFNSKTIKVCYIFNIYIKSNPMISY